MSVCLSDDYGHTSLPIVMIVFVTYEKRCDGTDFFFFWSEQDCGRVVEGELSRIKELCYFNEVGLKFSELQVITTSATKRLHLN